MNRKITVAHVVTSLDFGGVERHMENIACYSLNRSINHEFYAIGRGGDSEISLKKYNVKVECLNCSTSIPSTNSIYTLYKCFKKNQPTIVHTHGAEANFHGLIAAWLARIPVRIGEEIGVPTHSLRAQKVFQQVYRVAHRVIGVSDAVKRWLIKTGEIPEDKAVRIYNPIARSKFYSTGSGKNSVLRIGFVGRLEPVKNIFALVDAIRLLIDYHISTELWLVGDGSERSKLEEYINAIGLSDKVKLLGFQPDPNLTMRECDLFVLPSFTEGFSLALVEAMGLGLPVIATAVGGAPEIIEHGRSGWLLEDPSPAAIAKAIKHVAQMTSEDRQAVGRAAAEAVRGRFEPVAYLNEIESLYRQVLVQINGLSST